MAKWHNREDDVGDRSIHEESLFVSLFRIVSTSFEDNFYKRGRNVALKPELKGILVILCIHT